jgi:hypothetical protein
MLIHDSTCLQGPVTRNRAWWTLSNRDRIRTELVERIRREIARGTYDTPEKLEIALLRLLGRLES